MSSGHYKCPDCRVQFDDGGDCPECGQDQECFNEPYFSGRCRDCCGSSLAGNREFATGYNPAAKRVQEYSICEDCVYYAEYHQLDDTTMLEITSCMKTITTKWDLFRYLGGEHPLPVRFKDSSGLPHVGYLQSVERESGCGRSFNVRLGTDNGPVTFHFNTKD